MKRKPCPQCQKTLPVFLFSANRRISADKDGVSFLCPHCKAKLRAVSNEAHQKNFLMIVVVPLLFTPVVISLHSFIPSHLRAPYYFVAYLAIITYVVLKGQHQMDVTLLDKS